MKNSNNKVSVVIASYNNSKEIEKTIFSFINQNYQNKELIVIDGGSTDGTVNIINRYKKHISYWSCEPDNGISDAFNKGVIASLGDYIYFIGAGDYFWDEQVLSSMMDGVNSTQDLLVCGKVNRINMHGDKVIYTSSINFKKWHLIYKMGLPHQGLFTSKIFFKRHGYFDQNCKYSMDYELLLRAYKNFPSVRFKNVIVAAWKEGGIGSDKTIEVLNEYKRIRLKNKIAPKILIYIIDILSKLHYFCNRSQK